MHMSYQLLFLSSVTHSSEIGKKMKVIGEFQVKLQPLEFYAKGAEGINLGRMSLDKTLLELWRLLAKAKCLAL
jgi:hypothetical protein